MVDELENVGANTFRRINFDGKLLGKSKFLSIDPGPLIFRTKTTQLFFLLNFVEVVHDDADK